jgi:gamma-glutamyl phosphate reductase
VKDGYVKVHQSDLEKILEALTWAEQFFLNKNKSDAALHLAETIQSPLTSTIKLARQRVDGLLAGVNVREAE